MSTRENLGWSSIRSSTEKSNSKLPLYRNQVILENRGEGRWNTTPEVVHVLGF